MKSSKITQTSNPKSSIKIIGGAFKGKILNMDILPNTRPTKAIVRESLFNTLQESINDKIFVEVFAGYGSVGFEAYSRGAKQVIFIEKDTKTLEILQRNVKLFAKDNLDSFVVYHRDSLQFLDELLKSWQVDILYFDPPFGIEYYNQCFENLLRHNLENKIVIFEHISSFQMPKSIHTLQLTKSRKFGKSTISYYTQE